MKNSAIVDTTVKPNTHSAEINNPLNQSELNDCPPEHVPPIKPQARPPMKNVILGNQLNTKTSPVQSVNLAEPAKGVTVNIPPYIEQPGEKREPVNLPYTEKSTSEDERKAINLPYIEQPEAHAEEDDGMFDIEHADIAEIVNTIIKSQVKIIEVCTDIATTVNKFSDDMLMIKELLLDLIEKGK